MQVHVEPTVATAVPGTPLVLTAVITNDAAVERSCRVRVVGLEAPWVEHSDGDLRVPAGSRLEVPIRVTLPHGFPRGETLAGIEVVPDGDGTPIVVDLRLAVSDLESLSLGLSPVTVRGGWRGRFRLNIENRGTDPLTIKLSGRGTGPDDTKSELQFQFKPEELTLRSGERVKTRGFVSGRRSVFGSPRRRALTVTAQGQTAPRHVQGAFVQRPLMPKNILRIVGLVLVLAMWAGALTTGVRLTSKSNQLAAGQSASATAVGGNGTGGATGTGGTAGGADDKGTQTDVPPSTGGAVAGQVKGPTDPSGIKVALRSVALADDLSEDITLISATDDPKAKESAQALRREPAGPVGPVATTTTDPDGRWGFGGLKSPANYELTFSKAGFGERTYIVSVNDETPSVALDVSLVSGNGSLSGTVRGPDGPLGGVVVSATDGKVTFRTTTPTEGDVGTWSIDGLTTPGTYLIAAERRGFGTESTSLALGNGESKGGVDLTMVPGVGSISGRITGSGVPRGGLVVTAVGAVTRTATTLTEDPAGSFSLPQLPIPGDYTLTVAGDGWITQTMAVALKGNTKNVNLDLVPTTATIIGTVKDRSGKALPSTGVTLALDKPIVKTLTAVDPAGSYELTGLAPGTYTVTFDRADFKSEATIVTVNAGDRKTVDTTLTAQAGDKVPKDAVVRGIVRSNTTGNPISGVQVVMNSTPVTTDSTGAFVVKDLAPGSYDIAFTHTTYQATTRTVRIGAKSDTTIDVTMLALGGVQGVVTDLTATPIVGATVTITNDPAATGQPALTPISTTTNASGQYSLIERLRTGKYIATFTYLPPPGHVDYQDRTRNLEIAAGTTVTADTTLIELGQLVGSVQQPSSDVSGGYDAVAGATVTITPGIHAPITTDSNGYFEVLDLEPGTYTLSYSVTASILATPPRTVTVGLREIKDGSAIMAPAATPITGKVYYVDGLGVQQPIVGARVSTRAVSGFTTLLSIPYIRPVFNDYSATTNASGIWSLTGPLNGSTYKVEAPQGAQSSWYTTRNVPLVIPPLGGTTNIELQPARRTITGNVTFLPAVAVGVGRMATVALTGPVSQSTSSDNNGDYSFTDLPVGDYTVTVSKTNYVNNAGTVTVGVGDPATPIPAAAVQIQQKSSITVTVKELAPGLGTNGAVVGAATVKVFDSLNAQVGSGTTNGSGVINIPNLITGTYHVTADKSGYDTGTNASVTITTPGSNVPADVDLPRNSTLQVTVQSFVSSASTGSLTNATVVDAVPTIGTTIHLALVGSAYQSSDVPPGDYTLHVSAPGHDPNNTVTVTVNAGSGVVTTNVPLQRYPTLTIPIVRQHGADVLTPLPGMVVNAVRSTPAATFSLTDGNNDGTYVYDSLPPGTYTITVTDPGNAYLPISIALDDNGGTAGGDNVVAAGDPDITYAPAAALPFLAYPKLDVSVRDVSGTSHPPLIGVTVKAVRAAPAATFTLTDANADGTYTYPALPPGTYLITVVDPLLHHADLNVALFDGSDATVGAGDPDIAQGNVDALRFPQFSVHVDSEFTVPGQVATSSASLAGATVKLVRTVSDPLLPDFYTLTDDGSGNYSLAALYPDTYHLTAAATGHFPVDVPLNDGVNATVLAGDAAIVQPTIALTAKTGSFHGIVRDIRGATLTGVQITAQVNGQLQPEFTTPAGGAYSFTGLAPVVWTVTFRLSNYAPLTQQITIQKDTDGVVDVVLVKLGGSITGTTMGRTHATLGSAAALGTVNVDLQTSTGTSVTQTTSDGSGAFALDLISPGTYKIVYTKTGYVDEVQTSVVVNIDSLTTAVSPVLVASTVTATITTRASDGGHAPLDGAVIKIVGTNFATTQQVTSVAGTALFNSPKLAPDHYTLTVLTTPSHYATPSSQTFDVVVGNAPVAITIDFDRLGRATFTVGGLLDTDHAILNINTSVGAVATADVTRLSTFPMTFDDLPLGVPLTLTASATNYDLTPASPITVGNVTAGLAAAQTYAVGTITAAPHNGSIDLTVGGLLDADTATATISWTGGAWSTLISPLVVSGFSAAAQMQTIAVPAGVALSIDAASAKYNSPTTLVTSALGAGSTNVTQSVTMTPKDGSLIAHITGILPGDTATSMVTLGVSGAAAGGPFTFGNGDTALTPLLPSLVPYNTNFTVTVTNPANYTGGSDFTNIRLTHAQEARTLNIALTPNPGTVDVTVTGLSTAGAGDKVTVAISAGGYAPAAVNNIANGGTAHFSGAPAGVPITITLTPKGTNTGTYTGGLSGSTTITTAGGTATPSLVVN